MGMNQPGTFPANKLGGVTYAQSIGGSSPTSYLFYDQKSIYNGTAKFPKLGSKNVGQMTTVEIDGNSYPVSAAVEVQSTEGGNLLPRMTTAQRTATTGGPTGKGFIPVDGMQVFDTDLKAQMLYADDEWVQMATSSSGGVIGPASSTVSHIALWNNTSGTLLKDSPIFVDTTTGSMTGVGTILAANNSAASPTYSFSGAGNDSGMFFQNTFLRFSCNGFTQFVVLDSVDTANYLFLTGAASNGGTITGNNACILGVTGNGTDPSCDLGLVGMGANGDVAICPTNDGTSTKLKWWDNDGTNYVSFRAASNVASNIDFILPTVDAAGVMTSDGGGNLSLVPIDPTIYLKAVVTVSAVEFAAMYATPKLLIAGTAGKIIVIQEACLFFDYQGVPITGGGNCFPQYNNTINGGGTSAISAAITGGTITGLATDALIGRTGMSSLTLSSSSNGVGIYLSNQSLPFVPNGTTIKVTLIYTLIDFS